MGEEGAYHGLGFSFGLVEELVVEVLLEVEDVHLAVEEGHCEELAVEGEAEQGDGLAAELLDLDLALLSLEDLEGVVARGCK